MSSHGGTGVKISPMVTQKRLINEMKELKKERMDFAQIIQDQTNFFTFYCLLKGDEQTDYKNGYYIIKILLPEDYPANPGDMIVLTPNGRFIPNDKICLTITGYHPEHWAAAAWNLKTIVTAFQSIFITDSDVGLAHIRDSPSNRRKYAKESISFNLENYHDIFLQFDQFVKSDGSVYTNEEREDIEKEIKHQKQIKLEKKKEKLEKKEKKKLEKEKNKTETEIKPNLENNNCKSNNDESNIIQIIENSHTNENIQIDESKQKKKNRSKKTSVSISN